MVIRVCNGTGDEVTSMAWNGESNQDSPYRWPKCVPALLADWKLWQRVLNECLGLNQWKKLQTYLEKWFSMTSGWYLSLAQTSCGNMIWVGIFSNIPMVSNLEFNGGLGHPWHDLDVRYCRKTNHI